MNKIFADHVTNTAFFLSISKKQIKYLDHHFNYPFPNDLHYLRTNISATRDDPDNWYTSMHALEKKGLVVRKIHDTIRELGHWELTNAGQLVCKLLVEAGLIKKVETMEAVA